MVVLILTACPTGLRGDLTRWLFEIAPGVFVGRISVRVRDGLWERVLQHARAGRAIMVYPAKNEQRLAFRVHQPDWIPRDVDGVTLIMRPCGAEDATLFGTLPKGWSKAARHVAARRFCSRRRKKWTRMYNVGCITAGKKVCSPRTRG